MRLDVAWFTHPGGRRVNEDSLALAHDDEHLAEPHGIFSLRCATGKSPAGTPRSGDSAHPHTFQQRRQLVAALCDGLGGSVGGARASQICAETIAATLEDDGALGREVGGAEGSDVGGAAGREVRDGAGREVRDPTGREATDAEGSDVGGAAGREVRGAMGREVRDAIVQGHKALREVQAAEPAMRGARSTAVALAIRDGRAQWASVGDSRLYHFRAGELADVGPDDSAGWAAYARGEIDREGIRLWDGRSHLTAALGVPDGSITPHCGEALLAPGEAFLACSDGLWQYVWDVEMQIDLAKSATARQWLNLMLERLVARSQLDGDNLTALAVHIKE